MISKTMMASEPGEKLYIQNAVWCTSHLFIIQAVQSSI